MLCIPQKYRETQSLQSPIGSFLIFSITWLIEPLRIPLCLLCWEHDLNWTFLMKNFVYSDSFFLYHFHHKPNSYLSPFFGLGLWFYWFCHNHNTPDRLCFLPASFPHFCNAPIPFFLRRAMPFHLLSLVIGYAFLIISTIKTIKFLKRFYFWLSFLPPAGFLPRCLLDFFFWWHIPYFRIRAGSLASGFISASHSYGACQHTHSSAHASSPSACCLHSAST